MVNVLKILAACALFFIVVVLTYGFQIQGEINKPKDGSYKPLFGLEINDKIKELPYDDVIEFYNNFTKNEKISKAIVDKSLCYIVPVNNCMALAHTESHFEPKTVSKINLPSNSRDWGVFQLNDSFRKDWTVFDFYNIDKNCEEGIRSYTYTYNIFLKRGLPFTYLGYNMGPTGAAGCSVVPEFRKWYIDEIIQYEQELTKAFNERFNQG